MIKEQLVLSGLGGQGILFVTRLLAETAIAQGYPVLTSETHGMAQRGGVVISHLKVGEFSSPLVRPGQADALISLKGETLPLHLHFLKAGGFFATNAKSVPSSAEGVAGVTVDADALALELKDPQAVNLIVLGRTVAQTGKLFCSAEDVEAALRARMQGKEAALARALAAFRAGLEAKP